MVDHSHLLLYTLYKLEKKDNKHREEKSLRLYKNYYKGGPHVKGKFFEWLDYGHGLSVSLRDCPRERLDRERVQYVCHGQRKPYRVVFSHGSLVFKSNRTPVNTRNHADTIYVLSPKKKFYVADKVNKIFHHSSFMGGGEILCAGHLHVHNGRLDSISIVSGHYKPTEANFKLMKHFLRENHVDLRNVRMGTW